MDSHTALRRLAVYIYTNTGSTPSQAVSVARKLRQSVYTEKPNIKDEEVNNIIINSLNKFVEKYKFQLGKPLYTTIPW